MLFLLIRLAFLEFLTVIALKNVIAPNALRSFWFQRGLGSHFCLVFYSSRKNILELLLFTFFFCHLFVILGVILQNGFYLSSSYSPSLSLILFFHCVALKLSQYMSIKTTTLLPLPTVTRSFLSPRLLLLDRTTRTMFVPLLQRVFKLKKQRLIDVEIWGWV